MKNRKLTICNLDKVRLNTLYEDLRDEALRTSINYYKKSQGLTLFICKGMAAWIKAWTDCPSFHLSAKGQRGNFPQQNLPVDLRSKMAILLTNMAISVWQEVKTK